MTPEELELWNQDPRKVEIFVGRMVQLLRADDPGSSTIRAGIELIFRNYVRWISSAHKLEPNPNVVYATILHMIYVMIIDVSIQLKAVDENGVPISQFQSCNEFLDEIRDMLKSDEQFQKETANVVPFRHS